MPQIPHSLKNHHVYIIGKQRYGKTTVIQTHLRQHFLHKSGVCFIDPAGDAVDDLLPWIPEDRIDDTILFTTQNPPAIDFFDCTEDEKEDLVDDIVEIFQLPASAAVARPRIWEMLEAIIQAKINGLPTTFLDVAHFISDPIRRKQITDAAKRNIKFTESNYSAIAERMVRFTASKTLTALFSGQNPLNIMDVMQKQKILLVKLKRNETNRIVGGLIVSKIRQTAFRRPQGSRIPFFLYIDEFQNFKTAEFDSIITEAPKYQLCFCVAHQNMGQIESEALRESLLTCGTLIVFQLAKKSAVYFAEKMPPNTEYTGLINLPKYHAMYKIGDLDSYFHKIPPPPPRPNPQQLQIAETIMNRHKPHPPSQHRHTSHSEVDGNSGSHSEEDPKVLPPDRPSSHGRP